MVAGATSAAGLAAIQRMGARVRLLSALSGALELMHSEITFNFTPLPALTALLCRRAAPPVRPFFQHCTRLFQQLGEESVQALWHKAVCEAAVDWRAGEREALMDLGAALGRYDHQAQARALELTQNRIETLLARAESERARQGRVFGTLGVACGLAIVIILF